MAGATRVEGLIDEAVAAHPERAALIHAGRVWTYREVGAECDRRAGLLVDAGVGEGARIVTAAPPGADLILSFLACCRVGAALVTLSPLLTGPELRALATLADPALALTADGGPFAGAAAVRTLPLAPPGEPTPAARREAARRSATGGLDLPAAIRGTSGTTGARPKLAVRTHRQLTVCRATLAPWERPENVTSCHTPNQFMSGETCRVLGLGATLHLTSAATPRGVEADLARHAVTDLYTVPALLGTLVEGATPPPTGLRVGIIRVVGAALPRAIERAARERYGASVAAEYASTECAAIISALAEGTPPGSIGKPCPGAEVRLLDGDDQPVPPGEVGEIVVRSDRVMAGYLNDPAATAATLRDGWLHTGDNARQDADGFYYMVGRRGLLINVGAAKVAPEEVEAVLLGHPGVREVVIVAMPDEARGEVVRAIIVPEGDPPPTVEELQQFCRARLAGYKVPRRIEFRDSLPRSALGKVIRAQV